MTLPYLTLPFAAKEEILHDYTLQRKSEEFQRLFKRQILQLQTETENRKNNDRKIMKYLVEIFSPIFEVIKSEIVITLVAALIATAASTGIAYAAGALDTDEPITKEVLEEDNASWLLKSMKEWCWTPSCYLEVGLNWMRF